MNLNMTKPKSGYSAKLSKDENRELESTKNSKGVLGKSIDLPLKRIKDL